MTGGNSMKLHSLGISYRHDRNFGINRPNGSGDDLLLIFKSDAFVISDGCRIELPSDSAVLFPEGCPQIYGARGTEYENHWVHFECNKTDIFFDSINMRFGEPVICAGVSSAENVLSMLSMESVSENRDEVAEDLLLRLLILRTFGTGSRDTSVHSEALRKLRSEIYATPSGKFSIEMLSKRLSLSPSHFQALYKKEFGVSCGEDIIRARITAAKYYLENTELTVREISELCGCENDVHFIRQFKSRTGMTATHYRQHAAAPASLVR
ncbi:MAG: helix-turn-helix transcriptional regulator [Huintestinicola sp.]